MTIEGGCNCSAVRYTLALGALPLTYACHCHQCQRWSGSAFSQQALVPESAVTARGPIVVYEKVTKDRTSIQRVCRICHSRIYNTNTRSPGIAVIRAGTLDRSEELDCVAHIYTDYKQRWVDIPADVPSWPEAAPSDEFVQALMRDDQ